jgi:hypothetical protein
MTCQDAQRHAQLSEADLDASCVMQADPNHMVAVGSEGTFTRMASAMVVKDYSHLVTRAGTLSSHLALVLSAAGSG